MLPRIAKQMCSANANALRARTMSRLQQQKQLFRRFATQKDAPPSSGSSSGVTKAMVTHEIKEILKLVIGGSIVVTGLIASSGFVIETTKQWNPLPAPGTLLEITGEDGKAVSIHLQKKGSGDVTVIMDGGVGETSFDWDKVAEQVARFGTALAIDRPGLGFSSQGSLPRTSTQIAKEYLQVLEKLNVVGKVILVAHGAGGYNMRQLAEELSRKRNIQCEGIVLVDALQENLRGELESVSDAVHQALVAMDANGEMVLKLSRFGIVRLINVVQHKKFAEKYSAIALPYVDYFSPSPTHRQGALWENKGIPLTEQRFRDASPSTKFEFPCVVLSHGRADMFEGMKVQAGVDMAAIAALERKWQNAQRELVKHVSTKSVHVVVTDAGHCIHHEQPEAITNAIRALVNEAEGNERQGLASLQSCN